MIGRDNLSDLTRYGLAPWIAGAALAVFLMWIMFYLALPIGG